MKYSFIVPVYNGKKYIDRCFKSVLEQTYKNFEIIAIDDGSSDNSLEILEEYSEKYKSIKVFHEENKGLSEARNLGVSKANGDYVLFLDVDDTVDKNLLSTLENVMEKNLDLIKFGFRTILDEKEVNTYTHFEGKVCSGNIAFELLAFQKVVFEMAPLYAYNRKFYLDNKFSFKSGMYHEDFGLVPYIILKSKNIKLLDENMYNYYQTKDSITRNDSYKKTVKKANDIFDYYVLLKEKTKNDKAIKPRIKKIYYSFMANAVINAFNTLKGNDKKEYKNKIKEKNVIDDLLEDTNIRKIKKFILKIKI